MTRPLLLGFGGAHVDRRGRLSGPYVPGASNPGSMREEVGGGTLNALQNAVRHGVGARIVSVRGGDQQGLAVADAIGAAGIADLSSTFLDRRTASYTALLDQEGELICGLADMVIYEEALPRIVMRRHIREAIAAADAILVDANLPRPALEIVAGVATGKPIHAIAISPAKAERLTGILGRLACLFVNRREAERLTGSEDPLEAAARLRASGLGAAAITAGKDELVAFDGETSFRLKPPAVHQVADVTGAGDALAGTAIAGLMRGLPLRTALREGLAAAKLTIEAPTTVAAWDTDAFAAALALVPEAEAVA